VHHLQLQEHLPPELQVLVLLLQLVLQEPLLLPEPQLPLLE